MCEMKAKKVPRLKLEALNINRHHSETITTEVSRSKELKKESRKNQNLLLCNSIKSQASLRPKDAVTPLLDFETSETPAL